MNEDIKRLVERVEAADAPDGMLDRQCALALGWRERKVTSLGMNGRTPGRWRWYSPDGTGPRGCPRLTGPRTKAATLAQLQALASLTTKETDR